MRRIALPLLAAIGLLMAGCSDLGDPVEPADEGGDPDPSAVSFASDVFPIFQTHGCVTCHGFVGAAASLVNVPAEEYGGAVRIAPNEPDASVLFQKVSRTFVFGGPMPPSGGAVTQEQLDTIEAWILDGAPAN